MRLVITDLKEEEAKKLFKSTDDIKFITDNGTIKTCVGCFGCWVKTPGQCVINDGYNNMGELISKSSELIYISKCCYGWVSPFVKKVVDRSISYCIPFFEIRNKEMHHPIRYDNNPAIKINFYGEDITTEEKRLGERALKAFALNFDCKDTQLNYYNNATEMEGML